MAATEGVLGVLPDLHGRGTAIESPNRFAATHSIPDYADFEHDPEFLDELQRVRTEFVFGDAQSIVSENDSPDIPFRYSINTSRGCEHGCSYCYRPPKPATTPHLRILYGAKTSGRRGWRRNQPGATSTTPLMEPQPCVMAP